MARRYRCSNCGGEWEGKPACAACGIDPAKEPRFSALIAEVVVLHFDAPHPRVKGHGVGYWACDPSKRVAGTAATGEPSVVSCEKCRKTEAWKKAAGDDAEDMPPMLESEDHVVEPPETTRAAGGESIRVDEGGCCR